MVVVAKPRARPTPPLPSFGPNRKISTQQNQIYDIILSSADQITQYNTAQHGTNTTRNDTPSRHDPSARSLDCDDWSTPGRTCGVPGLPTGDTIYCVRLRIQQSYSEYHCIVCIHQAGMRQLYPCIVIRGAYALKRPEHLSHKQFNNGCGVANIIVTIAY